MILLLDNFVTLEECKKLIELYNQYKHLAHHWLGSYPISTSKIPHSLIKDILKRSEETVQKYFNPKFVVDWAEVKNNKKGSHHPFHYDKTSSATVLASVTYLSDSSSGHTIFKEGLRVSPKSGRMIIFDGKKYFHGVDKCLEDRYAIPIWYKHSSQTAGFKVEGTPTVSYL